MKRHGPPPGEENDTLRPLSWSAALLGLAACSRMTHPPADPPAARAIPVIGGRVERRDVPIWLEGLGNVTAFQTVTVRTQVDGRLDRVLFVEGQSVRRGQQIAQVDPRPFEIQRDQALGALVRDQGTLRDAEVTLARDQALLAKSLATQQQVDDAGAAVAQARGAVAIDQAQIAAAKLQIEYARITSPLDGVTGIRLVDPGNVVHQADPGGLVVITQLDPIAVLFTLPEDDLVRVARALREGALPVEARSRDGAARLAEGKLALIDNQINQATATMRLKAVFPNPDHLLWPNEFVKVRLLVATRRDVPVVPATTVQRGPQGAFAYVIGADDTVAMRPIEVDSLAGDEAIIGKGLSAGERIVVDGQNLLRPGAKVSVHAPSAAVEVRAAR